MIDSLHHCNIGWKKFFKEKRQKITIVGEDVEKKEPLYTVGGNASWRKPLWKTVWKIFKKLKIELPYDPAIPPLGIHLNKMKTLILDDICTPIS